jgi:hypothetical protein
MQFRTEFQVTNSENKITHSLNVMGFGSCFIDSIGENIQNSKFRILRNPFGTLFHPLAIENALARILSLTYYTKEEIFKYGELYFSWDHHSSFNRTSLDETLHKINSELEQANEFIQKTDVFFLTFGTSLVYKIKEMDIVVANCHKVPSFNFQKALLSDAQIKSSMRNCFNFILDINPKAKIITTISPVRHTKDGIVENNLSKSKLISCLHETLSLYDNVDYFPAYEIMMDDLRDYRFYKEDLIHPNEMAIQYIWEKFSETYFNQETLDKIAIAQKIERAMAHRPLNPKTIAYKEFLYKTKKQIESVENLFPKNSFQDEKTKLQNLMNHVD